MGDEQIKSSQHEQESLYNAEPLYTSKAIERTDFSHGLNTQKIDFINNK